jgi:DNA-binding MarR family transcriptional regulator
MQPAPELEPEPAAELSLAPEADPIAWVQRRWAAQDLPDPDRFAAAASLMRAHAIVTGEITGALRPHDLSLTAYLMLVTLALSDDAARSLSYLARYLLVHQTTVTQMVDRCEQRGLVRRRPHPSDRRTTLAYLTRSGRSLVRRASEDAARVGFGVNGMSGADLRKLQRALHELRAASGDLNA